MLCDSWHDVTQFESTNGPRFSRARGIHFFPPSHMSLLLDSNSYETRFRTDNESEQVERNFFPYYRLDRLRKTRQPEGLFARQMGESKISETKHLRNDCRVPLKW